MKLIIIAVIIIINEGLLNYMNIENWFDGDVGGGDGRCAGGQDVAYRPVHVLGFQRPLPAHGGGYALGRTGLQRAWPASGHSGHWRVLRLPGHAGAGHQRRRWIHPRLRSWRSFFPRGASICYFSMSPSYFAEWMITGMIRMNATAVTTVLLIQFLFIWHRHAATRSYAQIFFVLFFIKRW